MYFSLHKELFGDYEGDIMEKPKPSIMRRIRGTFLDFLQRENLEPLQVIFKASEDLGGYGFIDKLSALYGLIWNKPAFISCKAFACEVQMAVRSFWLAISRYSSV